MPKNEFFEAPPAKQEGQAPKDDVPSDWLTGFAPGQPPDVFKPGQAKLIPAGSDIVLEVHYMPEGKATTDQSRLGLVLAKEPPVERTMTLSAVNQSFKIPPGDPNFRVDASYTLPEDVTLLGLHPHMHMRGKSAQYRIVFPDGKTETLLDVPRYNWRWQLWYDLAEPLKLPKDTKIECTEHFDNSPNNRENPDPTKTVTWGQQSFDEMMVCMFNVAFDARITTRQMLAPPPPKPAQTRSEADCGARVSAVRTRGMTKLCLLVLLLLCPLPAGAQSPTGWPRPPRFRVVTLAERGGGEHQKFVDAAKIYLNALAAENDFAIDHITGTEGINEEFLAQYALFIQLNYPPYRWAPIAKAGLRGLHHTGQGRMDRLPPRRPSWRFRRVSHGSLVLAVHGRHPVHALPAGLRQGHGEDRGPVQPAGQRTAAVIRDRPRRVVHVEPVATSQRAACWLRSMSPATYRTR